MNSTFFLIYIYYNRLFRKRRSKELDFYFLLNENMYFLFFDKFRYKSYQVYKINIHTLVN